MFIICQAKKLVLVSAISIQMIVAYKKAYTLFIAKNSLLLECASYIYYLLYFKKDQAKVQTILDFDTKVNALISAYVASLSPKIRLTNIGAQKINSSTF